MSNQFRISGLQSASGQHYVRLESDTANATLRLEQFSLANSRLATDLTEAGWPIFTKKQFEEIVGEVGAIQYFAENRVAEYPGWNGKLYVQRDGTVFGSDAPPLVMFTPKTGMCRKRGTLKDWQTEVAMAIKDQPLLGIALMSAFLAPVLPVMPQAGNVAIEIVGPTSTGKSIAQMIAASVFGPASSIASMRDVLGDPEAARQDGRDHLLIIDQVHPVAITTAKSKKAQLFATVAFDLMRRPGGRVMLLSGRYPLAEACDMESEGSILTLLANGDGLGVFSTLPAGVDSPAALAAKLVLAVRRNHGHAYPAFLERLQAARTSKSAKVRSLLAQYHDQFLALVGLAAASGPERQAANTFAAIYAAGRLARRYRALPSQFPCRRLALSAFEQYRSLQATQLSFTDRLEALIACGQIVTLSPEADPALQAQAVAEALGTVATRATVRIVKIAPESIVKAFPDWSLIKGSPDVRAVLKKDGKNLAVWGKLAPGMARVRLFQFELPLLQSEGLFGPPSADKPDAE